MNEQERKEALKILSERYAGARPALHYNTEYELLVAVILSAQCTDARVNVVTAELFKEHNTPETMLTLSQEELEKYIFSCGLYRSKAAHILSASRDIVDRRIGRRRTIGSSTTGGRCAIRRSPTAPYARLRRCAIIIKRAKRIQNRGKCG